MNLAQAIEYSIATVLQEYAELGKDCAIRAWQSIAAENTWNPELDRTFPMVDVRAAPPQSVQTQHTFQVEVAVVCGTKTDDDRGHAEIAKLYTSVQKVLDALFAQALNTAGDELTRLLALIAENADPNTFSFGGFTYGSPLAPMDDRGVNMVGVTLVVHYGRTDF